MDKRHSSSAVIATANTTSYENRKTLDLLDELAKILGNPDGITLGQVNDVLVTAIMAIKAKDEIVDKLRTAAGIERDGVPFMPVLDLVLGMVENSEQYRLRLVDIHRDLANITGLKGQGVSISDQLASIRLGISTGAAISINLAPHDEQKVMPIVVELARAVGVISGDALPSGDFVKVLSLALDHVRRATRPANSDPVADRLRKILEKTDAIRDDIAAVIRIGGGS